MSASGSIPDVKQISRKGIHVGRPSWSSPTTGTNIIFDIISDARGKSALLTRCCCLVQGVGKDAGLSFLPSLHRQLPLNASDAASTK